MYVTVQVFHDLKRVFVDQELNLSNINAIDTETTIHYGVSGEYLCRRVVMNGTHVYVSVAEVEKLKQ